MTDEAAQPKTRDVRVDKIVSWVLGTFIVIAMTASVSAFKDLKNEIHSLSTVVSKLTTKVAVMEERERRMEQYVFDRLERLEERVTVLEKQK